MISVPYVQHESAGNVHILGADWARVNFPLLNAAFRNIEWLLTGVMVYSCCIRNRQKQSINMELHHLRTFVIVAEEKNVTRAAKRLFMTPPAVSAHIKALEEELNVTLFVRTSQGMQITEKGALIKAKAEQTLRAAQDLVNHATQMQAYLMGRIVIGLNTSPAFLRVAPLVTQLAANCPGIDLAFVSSVSGKIIDSLQNGNLDAGFIFSASPTDTLITHHLASVDLVVAAPKNWQSKIEQAQWQDIAALPWIHSTYYCPFQVIIEDLFARRNLKSQRIVEADDELTKCELVGAGLGLALLERQEAEHAAQTGRLVIWQTDPIPCDLNFACLRSRHDDPLIVALDAEVKRSWGG
jgi:DNA-binding transcriptional LysR family regulator